MTYDLCSIYDMIVDMSNTVYCIYIYVYIHVYIFACFKCHAIMNVMYTF